MTLPLWAPRRRGAARTASLAAIALALGLTACTNRGGSPETWLDIPFLGGSDRGERSGSSRAATAPAESASPPPAGEKAGARDAAPARAATAEPAGTAAGAGDAASGAAARGAANGDAAAATPKRAQREPGDLEPRYCYGTLADVVCYTRPQPERRGQRVGSFHDSIDP